MPVYCAPRRDFEFLLFELFGADAIWSATADMSHVDRELATAVIDECGKIAETLFAPLNASGDAEGCRFDAGAVTTPSGFRDAYRTYAEGGWVGLAGDPAYGGQGMPKMLTVAVEEMLFATNSSLYLYPALSAGAALLLANHASEDLKQQWLPPLYEGTFTGTMCLTEPHSGSDLGLLRTRAEPQADGSHSLTGTKIFITGGEHDLADNIVHLVLARLPDAPEGSRGISLFLVPKFLPDASGQPGARNAVAAGAIEHKMGIRGSATCVMNFDGATGWLIGPPHRGLACMFTMMNYERLSIGLQGLGSADYALQASLAYARERLQGRSPEREASSCGPADPLIVHPDVRRMLLTQKAYVEAGRAFAAFVGLQLDLARCAEDDARRAAARDLVAFLTPVAKAYFTDRGFDGCVLGQQVLGGHGYVTEWALEQYVRDARIAQIYEGTNGIQAMDLADRKLVRDGGRLAQRFMDTIESSLAAGDCDEDVRDRLQRALNDYRALTLRVVANGADDPSLAGSVAVDYLELTGLLAYAWLWARMMSVSRCAAEGADDDGFHAAKLATGRFFFERLLPLRETLQQRIDSGSEALMGLTAEAF